MNFLHDFESSENLSERRNVCIERARGGNESTDECICKDDDRIDKLTFIHSLGQ